MDTTAHDPITCAACNAPTTAIAAQCPGCGVTFEPYALDPREDEQTTTTASV
jgi:predicted amidophosphoribosyltransferase